jgi:hypothetical protein
LAASSLAGPDASLRSLLRTRGRTSLAVGWKLTVRRGSRIEYFVARAPDRDAAIAAVRKRRGMSKAEITISDEAPHDDLVWLTMSDGKARRVPSKS